jgi:tellurite methyltransferase
MTRSPWAHVYGRTPNEYIWGTEPSSLAREVSGLLRPGARVLELGCGEGRDSVFFATRGFAVTGVDISVAGLRKAERLARAARVSIRWVQSDLARWLGGGPYDLVYSCGAIHYVPRRRRIHLFRRLKLATSAGGYHSHVVFSDRSVYVEHGEVIDYFTEGELSRLYADWTLMRAERRLISCAQDGTAHEHSVEQIIARKSS